MILSNANYVELNPGPSNDVESNPGPSIINASIQLCGRCKNPVTWNNKAICCDTCTTWFHINCHNINDSTYEDSCSTSVSWHCFRCKQPNYSSIVFNSQSYTDNNNLSESLSRVDYTQQSLSFTSDSKIMIGKPLHQSTPTKAHRSPTGSKPKAISEGTPLTILNVNCQSVKSKVPQFINLVESTEPDIVLGTESWLSSDIHDSASSRDIQFTERTGMYMEEVYLF